MYRKHKTELNVGVKVNTLVSHVVYLNFISPKGGLLKYSQVPPIEWHDGTDSQLITEPTTEQVQQPQVLIYIYIQTHTHIYIHKNYHIRVGVGNGLLSFSDMPDAWATDY